MAKIAITVQVEKETHDVGLLVSQLIIDLKNKKPLAEIGATNLPALMSAVDGVQQIPAEFSEDLAASMKAILNPISDAVAALMKKDPAAPVA